MKTVRGIAFLSIIFAFLISLAFFLGKPVHAEQSWNVQTVDSNAAGYGNGYCPIVVDSNNMPSIAYTGPDSMKYARWNSSFGGFITQQITTGIAADMAFDANNNPHILYGLLAGGFKYASWTGLNWTLQTVDDTTYAVYGSLALDSTGNPHAAYSTGQTLKYARRSGSTWTTEIVDNGTDIQIRLSLAMDSNDKPYILYSNQGLTLATLENSGWKIETVTLPDPVSSYGNMVLDSKGHPHLIYSIEDIRAPEDNKIKHASWTGFSWKTQTVASSSNLYHVGNPGSLALDHLDYPHISFISSAGVMYAGWTGVEWNIQPVDSATGRNPVYMAVDSNRIPHISYRLGYENDPTNNLMYATATEPVPLASPLLIALPLLLVLTAVVIGAAVFVAYLWKKKT